VLPNRLFNLKKNSDLSPSPSAAWMWALWFLVSSFFFSRLSFSHLPKIKEKNHVVGTASIE
jgi:hypothetical protein